MYHKMKVGERIISPIDWEMTPELSFGTYESWGGRERVRDNDERVYYFFVDNWGDAPRVCLMERAVKHAKILAEIDVPATIVKKCVRDQGSSSRFEKSYAVDDVVKKWLIDHVLDGGDGSYVKPVAEQNVKEDMGAPLPSQGEGAWSFEKATLPTKPGVIVDEELGAIMKKWNFFDGVLNPAGLFENGLVDAGDGFTVIDERTGLQWQTGGIDICSTRTMTLKIEEINREGFAGLKDWRMPTLEEAMSLMEPSANAKDIHLNPCFSKEQPFIFVAAKRKPGGYWFVDFKHGRAFWSSGTIPGGFGRLCRTLT